MRHNRITTLNTPQGGALPMKVRNLNGTSQNDCSCGSWLKHWEKHSHKKADLCSAYGCMHKATKGGHVQKEDPADMHWYIVPLCDSCNNRFGQELSLAPGIEPISAIAD